MKKADLLSMLSMTILLLCGTAASAETIYLKDGTVVRGKIVQEEENAVMVESGASWRRIDRDAIELIKQDEPATAPAEPAPGQPAAIGPVVPPAAAAHRASAKDEGLYLGFQLPYNIIGGDFDGTNAPDVDPGLGIGLILGYRFNPQFGLEIDWAGSGHNSEGADIGFGEFSLNLKFSFLPDEATHPFLFAGVGAFALGDDSLTFGGTGYNLGVGVDFEVAEQNTIGIALIQKFITYDEILESDVPLVLVGTINGNTTSIRFDFTHRF